MTDQTPIDGAAVEAAAPQVQSAAIPPPRAWHKDTASVVVLAVAGGFVIAALSFATGWGAHGVADHVFGAGRGLAAGGFQHPGMMQSAPVGAPGGCDMRGGPGGFRGPGGPGGDRRGFQGAPDQGPGCGSGGCDQQGGPWQQ